MAHQNVKNDMMKEQLLKLGLKPSSKSNKSAKSKKHNTKTKSKINSNINSKANSKHIKPDVKLDAQKEQKSESKPESKQESRDERRNIKKQLKSLNKNDKKGEIKFHWVDNKTLRHVYVTEELRLKIANGELGLCYYRERTYVVEVSELDKVKALSEEIITYKASPKASDDVSDAGIPDDLMW